MKELRWFPSSFYLAVSDGVCSVCVGLLRMSEIFSCAETEKSDCPYCGICSIRNSAVVYRSIPLCDKRYAACVNVCWQHTKNRIKKGIVKKHRWSAFLYCREGRIPRSLAGHQA